jgi:pyruvate oxidase
MRTVAVTNRRRVARRPMPFRTADVIVDTLVAYGVRAIFGVPGDAVDWVMDAIRTHGKQIRFVHVMHEENGAFAAAGVAKLGGLGVCMGTAGPGAIHLLNGLYEAKMEHVPVVALTGQVATAHIGTGYIQEIDQSILFRGVSEFSATAMSSDRVPHLIDQACTIALERGGVAHLAVPIDVAGATMFHNPVRPGRRPAIPAPVPAAEELDRAAAILNEGEKVALLIGRGARLARDEVDRVARLLGAPVAYALLGKGVLPDDHPHVAGGAGRIGIPPGQRALDECDTLLLVGTNFPYSEFLPQEDVRTVQIDTDRQNLGKWLPLTLALEGDSRATLRELVPRLRPRDTSEFLAGIRQEKERWHQKLARKLDSDATPMPPQRLARALSEALEPNAVVVTDVGNVTAWIARDFVARDHTMLFSGWLQTMGCALGEAMGVAIAAPDRRVVAVCGDGGFAMSMTDFATLVKYRLPVTVVVFRNDMLAMIRFEQEEIGTPQFGVDLHNPDYARFAEACGARGFRVERTDELSPALREALHANAPVLLDVHVDPDEIPMPPRIGAGQAVRYGLAKLREFVSGAGGSESRESR